MRLARQLLVTATALVLAPLARADYDSHPDLRPEVRCSNIPPGVGDPEDPGGPGSVHCQKLIWDLPATLEEGVNRVAAPFDEDSIPRFPNGVTDRIPPMYVGLDAQGALDGFETLNGQPECAPGEAPGTGGCRKRLCGNVDEIPYWEPLYDEEGNRVTGTDGLGLSAVGNPGQPQEGPLFRLTCRRGSRSYFGPWQTGTQNDRFDRLTGNKQVRFENTGRLNRDIEAGHTTEDERFEWNMGSEIYNHFSSHHGTCYNPSHSCNDPGNTHPREAYEPGGECREYQQAANGPDDPEGEGACYAANEKPNCPGRNGEEFRNATQLPGRIAVELPGGRGVPSVEDPIWDCNHHVVMQLPPGSYGMTQLANYRLQTRGIRNSTDEAIYGAEPGEWIGGAVGEMIFQFFSEPADADVKPVNVTFNAVGDAATTFYPPFTWNYHESIWYGPYDAAIGLMTIHSHHRMVKGTMSFTGGHVPRLESTDPECGGMAGGEIPTDLYTNWNWEEAKICEYWRDPDGPPVLRKGQGIRTTCMVNNGVTPEAIKQGLVAGSVVEGLRSLGVPVPRPATVPTSEWRDLLVQSPIGEQFLYGTHPPENYRVKYSCGGVFGQGEGSLPFVSVPTPLQGGPICDPNPNVDEDGDYVDGPYRNPEQCGGEGWCNPAPIVFACVGEEEMCIGVAMYWALPRLGNPETNDEALENLQEGNLQGVGTPGSTGLRTDVIVGGSCHDCEPGL